MSSIKVENKGPLLDAVMQMMNYGSATKGRDLIKSGRVAVNGKTVKHPGDLVEKGSTVALVEKVVSDYAKSRSTFPYPVLANDDNWFVFVKPKGIPVLSQDGSMFTAYKFYMEYMASLNVSIIDHYAVNKVDRRESGIVIIAKSLKNRRITEEALKAASFKYYALVEGQFPEKDVVLTDHFSTNKIGYLVPSRDSRALEVVLNCRLMKAGKDLSLVKVTPATEVKNQIRAGLSNAGFPIAGDKRYGSETNPLSRTCLHLFSIEMKHPITGETVLFRTDVPRDFLNAVKVRNKKNIVVAGKKVVSKKKP